MFKSLLVAALLAVTPQQATDAGSPAHVTQTAKPSTARADLTARREMLVLMMDEMSIRLGDKLERTVKVDSIFWGGVTATSGSALVILTVGDKKLAMVYLFNEETGRFRQLQEDFVPESQLGPDGKELGF